MSDITRKTIAERLLQSTITDLKYQIEYQDGAIDWDHFIETAKRGKLAHNALTEELNKEKLNSNEESKAV